MVKVAALGVASLMLGVIVSVGAERRTINQTANVKQIELQKADVPEGNYEVRFDMMEISVAAVARHTHPGPTLVYVLEGGFTLLMDGLSPEVVQGGRLFRGAYWRCP